MLCPSAPASRWKRGPGSGNDGHVLGALVLALVIVVILPVTFFLIGSLLTAVMGWFLKESVEDSHEGSELVDLNY